MGSILLQERLAQRPRCRLERGPVGGERRGKPADSGCGPDTAPSSKMGRRQPQRKPRSSLPAPEGDRRPPQRRKHKPNATVTSSTSQHNSQGSSESRPSSGPAEDRPEQRVAPQDILCSTQLKHRASQQTKAGLSCRPSDSSSSPLCGGDADSDTDLSDTERGPALPPAGEPPQMQLQPEIQEDGRLSRGCRSKAQGAHAEFNYPDFLPPPFNSWSLTQLAIFYNTEGRGASRPRLVGPLERYLERLLHLEWQQIQTLQEESRKSIASDVTLSNNRSTAAATSLRLSSPKCILQCQRGFPLSFLSSLAGHSTLLSGYSSVPCCRSTHNHGRQSRLSPLEAHKGPAPLPRRSYSESRVHFSERGLGRLRDSSPARTSSHLKRMQASGNIRNPPQGPNAKNNPSAKERGICGAHPDHRATVGCRMRSGSEQRREWRRAELREREIKPDAVAAIMDNLPGSKYSYISRSNRHKQVEFVT